jgi:hypothetical protein
MGKAPATVEAFTVIELLVVIGVFCVLMPLLLPASSPPATPTDEPSEPPSQALAATTPRSVHSAPIAPDFRKLRSIGSRGSVRRRFHP